MKLVRYTMNLINKRILGHRTPERVLFYLGVHRGNSFDKIFMNFSKCYCFEANPELCAELRTKYRRARNVVIVNAALCVEDGEADFNISSNDAASSSMGHFHEEWNHFRNGEITFVKKIRVPSMNLYNYCLNNEIKNIDTYISDIQGMDLQVLKTMKTFIDDGKIGTIQCEVTKNSRGNLYQDLPDNSESGFIEFLDGKYELVAKGWGLLNEGVVEDVPNDWWEFDCRWRLRQKNCATF